MHVSATVTSTTLAAPPIELSVVGPVLVRRMRRLQRALAPKEGETEARSAESGLAWPQEPKAPPSDCGG